MAEKPTLAIALEYDGDEAPRVTARGYDELAEEIVRIARQSNVPLHHDNDLAKVLDQLDLGDQIPPTLYLAIAEILCFAYSLSGKHKPFMDQYQTTTDTAD
ncbi:MAG: EscU/YscU/HrcU family type III secretion system export apparatus switch protein [Pseudomonadota bacterium]